MTVAYIFNDPQVFVSILDRVLDKYLEPTQHDAHVWKYVRIMQAYGSVRGWHEHQFQVAMRRQFERMFNNGE